MRPTFRFIPLLLLLALITFSVRLDAAGEGRISGKIKAPGGQGLLGAVVAVFTEGSDGSTIALTRSDRNGSYVFAGLAPGSYYLEVSRPGYEPITTEGVKIQPGKTTNFDVVLQEFVDSISDNSDPRNWDAKTVMRSASSRRLIFRDIQGQDGASAEAEPEPFYRGGALTVTSTADTSDQNYAMYPGGDQTNILSNFAFTEPVSEHGRMIFSGQINSGYESSWRVRNTYNYRAGLERDVKVSFGYGRLNLNGAPTQSIGRPSQFFAQDLDMRESGIQTVALGLEGSNRILDTVSMVYGFDATRVYYGEAKNYLSPYFQLTLTPIGSWSVKGMLSSKRVSEYNSLSLPDGEMLNLSEPVSITRIDGEIHVSEIKHAELALGKTLRGETAVEVAVYDDRVSGPGTPFLVTREVPDPASTQVLQLRGDQSAQRGLRVMVNRKLLDFLNGSLSYVYGTATAATGTSDSDSSDVIAHNLLNYMQRSYYHSLTGQVDTRIQRTKTNLITIVRWYSGDPLTPIDLFSDKMDIMTKGVNVLLRQAIPVPEFLGGGRWEALVDVRNLFDQGIGRIHTSDGDLLLTRNPRSLRFGLNLNFY